VSVFLGEDQFYELEVWKNGKDLVLGIYEFTRHYPRRETYSLTDQLRRAAVSICANIAEGFERYHTKDKMRFYYHARGSLSECKSHIIISQELGYIDQAAARKIIDECDIVGRQLNAMISSLSKRLPS
jgi:four helix bundle protein